ncbi:MAG: hypothetical protein HOH24_02205, partial [Chromatiales bacterium]|nr:hypothetical protein [Chromatiales bacterium]
LVEIIPAKTTNPELIDACVHWFAKLGKKPLLGFDTPNFIANRIGVFSFMKAIQLMDKYGFNTEEVDMITGTPIGAPKTATFRLADLVGLDVLYHVSKNSYDACVDDEQRDTLKPPAIFERMMEEKKLGDKTGGGFFKKTKVNGKRAILTLDLKTWEYLPGMKPKSDCVRVAKGFVSPADRVASMVGYGDDPVSNFAKELVLSTSAYALNRVGEAAPDIATVDKALKWGFSRSIGPVETLDAIGLEKSARLMSELGMAVPKLLTEAIESTGSFYRKEPSKIFAFNHKSKELVQEPKRDVIRLAELRDQGKVIRENINARLYDLGDGILGCELDGHIFLAPDNGILSDVIGSRTNTPCYRLNEAMLQSLNPGKISATFHGRDVFAPLAAEIASGRIGVNAIGSATRDIVPSLVEGPEKLGSRLQGTIVAVDSFGNLISNVSRKALSELNQPVINCGGRNLLLQDTYGRSQPGELLALINSFGMLEIARAEGNAAQFLSLGLGAPISITER